MAKNTHERLEHAEHAEHAAADPFDRRVAVSMAIIAAALAGISMIGHRKHNEVLRLVGEAAALRTESSAAEVKKSNTFAWYQSKRNRQAQYEGDATLLELGIATAEAQAAGGKMADAVAKSRRESEKYRKDAEKYKHELEDLQKEGEKYGTEAESLMAESRRFSEQSHHAHKQADRLDIAHLLAEVALVVCSVSMLTKKKAFWLGGCLAAALALAVAGSAYAIPHEPHSAAGHAAPADHPPADKPKGKEQPADTHGAGKPAGKEHGPGH